MKRILVVLMAAMLFASGFAEEWNPTSHFGYDRPMSATTLMVQLISFVGPGGKLETSIEAGHVVLIYTSTPLKDDSVHRIRVRLELAEEVDGRYTVRTQGAQYQCQQGRGQQDFAAKLCL